MKIRSLNLLITLLIVSLFFIIKPSPALASCSGALPGINSVTLNGGVCTISIVDGVDKADNIETSTTNTGLLTLSGGANLTINSTGALTLGRLSVVNGTVSTALGAQVLVGTTLYVPDADADGYATSFSTLYTATASGRRRLSLMKSPTTVDCNDGNLAITTSPLAKWVATGEGANTLAYSNDGITWVGLGTSIFQSNGYDVAWNGSKFTAVGIGASNSVAYSYDGSNWTGLGKPSSMTWGYGIAWNGTRWVAGAAGQPLAYSTDGSSWTGLGSSIFSSSAMGFAWNGTRWVAAGQGSANTLAYSSDGTSWTGSGKTIFTSQGTDVAWNGTRFVAVGGGTNTIAYSSDGISWTGLGTSIFSSVGYGVAWNGTRFVAVGQGTNTIAYSTDGISWTGIGTSIFSVNGQQVAWNGTRFVATGQGTNSLAYSANGIAWTGVGTSIFSYGWGIASAPAPSLVPSITGSCP